MTDGSDSTARYIKHRAMMHALMSICLCSTHGHRFVLVPLTDAQVAVMTQLNIEYPLMQRCTRCGHEEEAAT